MVKIGSVCQGVYRLAPNDKPPEIHHEKIK